MQRLKNILFVKPFALIVFVWLFQNIFIFSHFGIVSDYEATKYIEQAYHFLNTGTYTSNNFIFYSVQIFLIGISIKLKTGYWLVIFIQLLLNAVSTYLLFCLMWKKTKNKFLAYVGTLFFLLMFYYHLYNFYLFTESIYFSLSIIYTYYIFSLHKLKLKQGLYVGILLLLLYLTRPIGIFFIPATLLYLIIRFKKTSLNTTLLLCFFVLGFLFYILLNFSLSSGGELNFLLPYLQEMIICGIPTVKTENNITVPIEKNSIEGLFYIIHYYPQLFFKLSIKRLAVFWGLVRPYYTLIHNIFIAIYFYILYVVILLNFKRTYNTFKPEFLFIITKLFFITVTVMVSCDEWHNRFILAYMPFLLLLAIFSLSTFNLPALKHFKKKKH